MQTSHCWTPRLWGEVSEMRASWALCFGIQKQTSRVWCSSKEMQAWASCLISAGRMVFPTFCFCCQRACCLCRRSAFWLRCTGCWGPLVTWSWGRGGGVARLAFNNVGPRVSWKMLTRATHVKRPEMALFTQAIFGEVSEKTWEWISEKTLRYCRATLGLLEPEEKRETPHTLPDRILRQVTQSFFSWRWRHLAPQLAHQWRKKSLMESPSLVWRGDLKICIVKFSWINERLQQF